MIPDKNDRKPGFFSTFGGMKRSVIFLSLISFVLLTSIPDTLAQKPFSRAERRTIRTGEGIMRLCTINDPQDSLLIRQKAAALTPRAMRSKNFATLCDRMLQTVNDPGNEGVGIAAPQVGVSCRLIAVQRYDKPGQPFEFYANPTIVRYGEPWKSGPEGCLSVPGMWGKVDRAQEIVLRYTDPATGESREEVVKGYTAVIFQHETDHLDGILYIDKATELKHE